MSEENIKRSPAVIKNLADFKRHIEVGTEITAVYHKNHPDIAGLTRVVTKVQSNAFYSVIKDRLEHKFSACNRGQGFRSDFEKACFYRFNGTTVQALDPRSKDGSILYEIEVYDKGIKTNEARKEESNMNEWERLRKQAEMYKERFPEGTRILLLNMGADPNPVKGGTRGTVRFVDDIGTVHCAFDNGRTLGMIPGEDNFRKLTAEELAQEQAADMDESDMDEDGNVTVLRM